MISALAHVPVLIFIANFSKVKFGIKTLVAKDNLVNEEPDKIIEVKDTVVKKREGRNFKRTIK